MPVNQEGTINVTNNVAGSSQSNIEALLSGATSKWGGALGTGAAITYSFPGNFLGDDSFWAADYSTPDEYLNMSYLNAEQATAFAAAVQAWEDVANITFNLIADDPTSGGTKGVIRVAFYNDMTNASGYAYLPTTLAAGGDVWLNPDEDIWAGSDLLPGGSGYDTMLHELGHALGLTHPLNLGTAAGFDARTTIMSYNIQPHGYFRDVTTTGSGSSWTWIPIEPQTPMIDDIAAMQYLYGANMSFHTGADTYTFSPTTPFLKTIWDAGGIDTISVSNFTRACEIDLQAGHLSSIMIPSDPLPSGAPVNSFFDAPINLYNGTDNLGIAFGAIIENATGGSGGDTLSGNASKNVLTGNGGKDTLNGIGGIDTLLGGIGDDTLNGGAGNDTLNGGAGLDTLNGNAGKDIFLFDVAPATANVDRIAGFSHVDDTIRLDNDFYTALTTGENLTLKAAEYKENATGKATQADDRIIYNTTNGGLFYDADGNGAGAAVKIATLSGAPDIDASDIFIVG